MRRLPCTSYAAPRRGGQVVQTEAPNGSHSGSIPDPATDADTAQARIVTTLADLLEGDRRLGLIVGRLPGVSV